MMQRLEDLGLISRTPGQARSIVLPASPGLLRDCDLKGRLFQQVPKSIGISTTRIILGRGPVRSG